MAFATPTSATTIELLQWQDQYQCVQCGRSYWASIVASERVCPRCDALRESIAAGNWDACEVCRKEPYDKIDGRGVKVCKVCDARRTGPVVRSGQPAGRNDACPCGSGKKRKRCCK